MMPFDVLVPDVPDPKLASLLTRLHAEGFNPTITPASADALHQQAAATPSVSGGELPANWQLVRELEDQSFKWPSNEIDEYWRYRVFAAPTPSGLVHMAIGDAERQKVFGRDRKYSIVFLTSGPPQTPLVELMEVDDYEESRQLIAIIRGSDGGKKMYAPTSSLPAVYQENFDIQVFADRIVAPRAWNKLAVVVHEDDHTAILNHALLQARRRGDL
jgi:hypothetical protein